MDESQSNPEAARRKPGTGSVRLHKSGFWEARLHVKTANGPKTISKYRKTREAAEEILDEIVAATKKDPETVTHFRRQRTHLYFVQAQNSGYIKIGVASNVRKRVSNMQTDSPEPLKILKTIPDVGREMEKHLHKVFASQKVNGEWFEPHPELLRFIDPAKAPRSRIRSP